VCALNVLEDELMIGLGCRTGRLRVGQVKEGTKGMRKLLMYSFGV
jgi:hypothetical protein